MGSTCRPYPIAHRAGKGPLHMAEDFTLHQLLGNSRTVERHKLLHLATTQAMNGLGTHLLAGTTLAGDEDGSPGGGSRFYGAVDLLHGQRRTDKPLEAFALELILITTDQHIELAKLQRIAQCHLQTLGIHRFGDEVMSPQPHGIHHLVHRAMGGHHYGADPQLCLMDMAQDLHSAHIRQMQIQQQDIGQMLSKLRQCRLATGHTNELEGFALQIGAINGSKGSRIFDHQDTGQMRAHSFIPDWVYR